MVSQPITLNALSPLNPKADEDKNEEEILKEEEIGLCLSGGGYRAMLFHAGVIWRMFQLGILPKLHRISSVSGGSITAALLGIKWHAVAAKSCSEQEFINEFISPLRELARVEIDVTSVAKGVALPGTINEYVSGAFAKHIFGTSTLQDLPDDPPRFVLNATNVQTGSLWRFSKPFMRDYQVGQVKNPKILLSDAVAASSAFPPFLSPAILHLKEEAFASSEGEPLHEPPYMTKVILTDGGVYDNLGLETVWKRCKTVLVSDAGQKMNPEPEPHEDWAQHSRRILELIDNQVRSLRRRQLFASHEAGERRVAYWSIRSDIAKYSVHSLWCPVERTMQLAKIPTRLSSLPEDTQERLINWGYAICDAALRAWFDKGIAPATEFPYNDIAV